MAALTAALLGLAAVSTFKSLTDKGPAAPTLPTAPPPIDPSTAVAAGAAARRKLATSTTGRSGTLLTGPSGVSVPALVQRKTLLGS